MDTLKLIGFALVITVIVCAAALVGNSKLPKSEFCEVNYRIDGTWQPVGWKLEEFPRTDCKFPSDRFVDEDGTWGWK